MRLTGLVFVAISAAALLGWYHPFEGVCSGAVLVAILIAWALLARASSRGGDDDDEYPNEASRGREVVFGILIGFVWVLLAFLTIHTLRNTRVHGWFVDEPGESLAHDLEILARNGAWPSILTRLDGRLPVHAGRAARIAIDRFHYLALAHTAATIADNGARCTAQRAAETFADVHGLDPVDHVPVTCQAATLPGRSTAGANLSLLKQEVDPVGRTVLTVAVSGSSGAPVAGLSQTNFVAVADGREVAIADLIYAPSNLPRRRFVLVIGPMRSRAHSDLAQAARGVLTGLMRATDRVETIICCAAAQDLSDALLSALDHIRSQPGGLILLAEDQESMSSESASDLLRRLRDARSSLHLLLFGASGAGVPQLERIARDSRGTLLRVTGDNLASVRNVLASSVAREGVYFVVLGGRFRNVSIALASSGRDASK